MLLCFCECTVELGFHSHLSAQETASAKANTVCERTFLVVLVSVYLCNHTVEHMHLHFHKDGNVSKFHTNSQEITYFLCSVPLSLVSNNFPFLHFSCFANSFCWLKNLMQ